MSNTITPAEFALAIDANPRTVRKFLRSADGLDMKVGKGQRWAIESRQVASLKKRFTKWNEAQAKAPQDTFGPGDEAAEALNPND